MNHMIKVGFVIVAFGLIQGCSSMGIGKPEYGCTGLPEGVRCMSAKDVYHNTNGGNNPAPIKAKNDGNDEENTPIADNAASQSHYNDVVTKRYVEANLPYQPIPIRTPSQTMRIFVAPYEDVDGDLLVPGLVYTDIEERRWVIGEPQAGSHTNSSFKLAKPKR